MLLNNILTNLVKEKGISNIIIEMKENFELYDKITEHKNRNKNILNDIKCYKYEYNFIFDSNGSINKIFYSNLNEVHNKYGNDIRNNIMDVYGLEIERLYEELELDREYDVKIRVEDLSQLKIIIKCQHNHILEEISFEMI